MIKILDYVAAGIIYTGLWVGGIIATLLILGSAYFLLGLVVGALRYL